MFHFLSQLCPFEMFFEKMEEAACPWGHHPGSRAALDLGKGVARHWELLPQSPALTPHFQTCPWVSCECRGGGGRSREGLTRCLPQACLSTAPWATREGGDFWNGCREGVRELESRAEGKGADRSYWPLFLCTPSYGSEVVLLLAFCLQILAFK